MSTHETNFTVNVTAHTGPRAPVPFMIRPFTSEELSIVRQRLSAAVAELNDEYPALAFSIAEE
jgi:hypothetical protein